MDDDGNKILYPAAGAGVVLDLKTGITSVTFFSVS